MAVDLQMKILLVEDAATMRKMEAKILNQVGFENIVEAADGKEAIEKLQGEDDIGLIISDWAMPNMDGYELLTWVRGEERCREIPFLMATGHGDKEYVAKAKEGGANGVVAKPFTPDELKVLIDEIFGVRKREVKKDEGPKVSSQGKVRLRMAHIQITDHLPLGVLRHQIESGVRKPANFDIETLCMGGWNPVLKALESGEVDGAFVLAPTAMDLFSYDVPIKLVLFAHRNGSIAVRNASGKYSKPYQQFFKHKSFLIPHKMSIHNMLAHMYFTQMGLRPGVAGKEAVNVLFDVVPPIGMPGFLKENPEVSGFMVAEPIGSRAIAAGIAEQQFLSSEIWDGHPCCVVVFRDEFINTYPQAVQEFTTMLVEAGLFIRDNVDQAAEIAVKFLDPQGNLGLEPTLLRNVLSDPEGITTDDLYPETADLDTIQRYMTSKMEIGRVIDLNNFVDSRFADETYRQLSLSRHPARAGKVEGDGEPKPHAFEQTQTIASREGKYLIFHLADERYGVGVLDVREIIGLMEITELPNMPSFFEGVVNLRDKVIPVLDMRAKFGMERVEHTERTCIIVVEISGIRGSILMGVVVDGVSEVANVKDAEVEDAPVFGKGVDTSFILGMAKMEAGVTILLDIDRILHTSEMVQLSGAV